LSSTELTEAVALASRALADNPQGHLPLVARQRLWNSMGPLRLHEHRSLLHPGLYGRTHLAITCVQKVLPFWEQIVPTDRRPHHLLRQIYEYFSSKIDDVQLSRLIGEMWTVVDGLMSQKADVRLLVGCAAAQAASTALTDEIFDPERLGEESDCDRDAYQWDAAFYSAAVYAGGTPWAENADSTRRKEFWTWYLTYAIPENRQAWGQFPERAD
jgi:hypothetical protein